MRAVLSVLAACLLAASLPLAAQPHTGRAVAFGVSPRLDGLPAPESDKPEDTGEVKIVPLKPFRAEADNPAAVSIDPAVQDSAPPEALAPPTLVFPGLSSDDNQAAFGGRVMPPDTVGDVGPNDYVQMINNLFRVYDKAGNPRTAKLTLGSLWAAIPGSCANRNDGDPIVLYDPLADRWLLSQFCTVANPNNHQLIAISQTSDPAGAYYVYDFPMPNNKFNDYPKFGVWTDAYYMTDNQFNQAGTLFLGAGAFAFDRAKMLAGDPSATYVYFDVENGNPAIGGMLPADVDGILPPPAGAPGLFAYFTADELSGPPVDGLRIFELRPNFANPAASTFTERAESPVAVAPFDPRSPAGRDDIEQPPPASSSAYLDSISDRLMFRLAYRNFGDHESLVVNHTVNVSGVAPTSPASHRTGVRYYELRRSGGGPFSVAEQATFAPDTDNRWMGSAAQDNDGNLAVGYSVSSLTTFPSIRVAGRLATDPPGGLFQGETTLVAGTGSQTATASRWGDYSALSVDPADDCTFWYTTEYYTAASAANSFGWLTSIANFSFPGCTPAERGTISGVVTNSLTGLPIHNATVRTTNGYQRASGAAGDYSMGVAPGTYDMTASAPLYEPAAASGVTVAAGGTATQNFALTPIPLLMSAGGQAVVAEACGPANGAIDPGEAVTVTLAVRNVGSADTVNLVGTLLPTGGVTSPGPPQSFGVVVAGGPSVSRPFSFTAAGSCGDAITVTLHLEDGARDLGLVSYSFNLGALNPFGQTRSTSSGNLNVALPDVSSIEVPLVVTDTGGISDVNVKVRLNHTFDGDLSLSLVHPDGTVVQLSNRRGGGGDNFGAGANDCSGTPTVFDDEAAVAIASGTAPFAGSFRPDQPLSALDGKPTNGTWKLRISDNAGADVGTLFCFQLELGQRVYACCGVPGTPFLLSHGASVAAESCSPANGAIDPDETASVAFTLANAGSGATTDLTATLLPGGGVQMPGAPQSYGAVLAGATATRTFSFVPAGTCGGTVTATLQLQDGPFDLGTLTFPLRLGTTVGAAYGPFDNGAQISIPGAAGATSGVAAPYPSTVAVSGIAGTVSKVTVKLSGFSHTFPDDVDVLLVSPGGQKVILMSDAGGSTDAVDADLTFDDDAAAAIPDSTALTTGTFRPADYAPSETFPAPGPAGPYATTLADFNGTDPNGTWSLYVFDDAGADAGRIARGWSIDFQTADPVCCSQACSLDCPAVRQGSDPDRCDAGVSFPFPVVTGSCGTLACAPPSGSVFPVGVTTDTCTATTQAGATTTCSFPVTVEDVQAPAIAGASISSASLWPPDHRMVPLTVSYSTADNCSAPAATACVLSAASDEPINGLGDGDAAPDWQILDAHHLRLRAERSGVGDGRVYTVTITCTDEAGRSSSQTVTVNVPFDES